MPFNVLWLSQADIDTRGITRPEIMDEVVRGFVNQWQGDIVMPAKIVIPPGRTAPRPRTACPGAATGGPT
ncbi:MAG: hypothetical protein KKA55_13030 [Proteobacteria bacterium]|nr:hypothetical protein [Pseudomonadota bacterium]MBU1596442.1 hypothetical protein [Pseudomonadota bacterium]